MAKELLCTNCGYKGWPKSKTKRSIFEFVLWLFLSIPDFIRSAWRRTGSYGQCPICGSRNMIPSTSPRAKQILSASKESLSTAVADSPEDLDNL